MVKCTLHVSYQIQLYTCTLFANDGSPMTYLISAISSCVLGYNGSMPQ